MPHNRSMHTHATGLQRCTNATPSNTQPHEPQHREPAATPADLDEAIEEIDRHMDRIYQRAALLHLAIDETNGTTGWDALQRAATYVNGLRERVAKHVETMLREN